MRRPTAPGTAPAGIGLLALILAACPAPAAEDGAGASRPEHARRERTPWSGAARPSGPDGGWTLTAGLALALAVAGAAAVAARRKGVRSTAGDVQVVGRVSLSARHSVFLLRVGRRTLVVGAGPQGPPSLIAELDDLPHEPPAGPAVGGS